MKQICLTCSTVLRNWATVYWLPKTTTFGQNTYFSTENNILDLNNRLHYLGYVSLLRSLCNSETETSIHVLPL